jgi:mono/diheme cytochrome c family protein
MKNKPKSMIIVALLLLLFGASLYAKKMLYWEDAAENQIPQTPELVKRGERIYQAACAYCHGEKGDGNGIASKYLFTKPRDLTTGKFNIRTTPSGSLPTDADLFRTITVGFPEHRMPTFQYLSAEERWAVVYYIKTLSPLFSERTPKDPVEIGAPPQKTAELIAQGKEVYQNFGCLACHGETGRGDGPSASMLTDDKGRALLMPDFTHGERVFKRGGRARDILMTLHTGMLGSAMPSFQMAFESTLTNEQVWGLAYYVESLAQTTETEE